MQKLGTGLLISRMIIDGPRVFCERMDGSWQCGTEREGAALALDAVECSDSVRVILEEAARTAARRPQPISPTVGEDEMAGLLRTLSPDIKEELLGLLRLRVGAGVPEPMSSDIQADEPSLGYVYTDPDTGAKRWVASDLPPETSAAHPCPHCQKVWSSERSLLTHARQCADNPDSVNFKGIAAPVEGE